MGLGGINVSNSLILGVLLVGLVLFLIVFSLLKRGRISIKYALVFFVPILIIVFVGAIPSFIWNLAETLGFQSIATLVIGIMIVLLFLFIISLIVIVSGQRTKLTLLIQELSMMKQELKELKDQQKNG